MVFDLLFDPDRFFEEEVNFRKPLWRGFIVVLLAAILASINAAILAPALSRATYQFLVEKGANPEFAKLAAQMANTSAITAPVAIFIMWVITAAVLYGISAIFGGSGDFSDTLKVTAYSFLPEIVVFPFRLYITLTEVKLLNAYGFSALLTASGLKTAGLILSLAVLVWQFMLWKYGIKHARNLNDRDSTIVAGILAAALALLSIAGFFHKPGTIRTLK